jgi:hypothetical protein
MRPVLARIVAIGLLAAVVVFAALFALGVN